MTNKNKKQNQDDLWEEYGSSAGIEMVGTGTLDSGIDVSYDGVTYTQGYSMPDIGQLDLFVEEDMREKYPALKQAWEHYQSVLEVCKTKEKEDDEN